MKSFLIKLFSSLLVGSFFGIWVFKNIDFLELVELGSQLNFAFILLGIVFYGTALFIRAFRWQKLLFPFAPLTHLQVLKALIVGYAMNVILPARLGELFRVNICKKWYSLSRSTALATIIWERVADGITVVACLILGALSIRSLSNQNEIHALIFVGASLFSFAILVLVLLRKFSLDQLLQKFPKIKLRVMLFQKGIQEISSATLIWTIAISLLVWTFDGLSLWAIVRATGITLGFLNSALLIGVVSLSTLLPSPPGFLGTMQFAFGIALLACNYPAVSGVLAATLTQIFLLGTLTIIGISLLVWASVKKPKMDLQT